MNQNILHKEVQDFIQANLETNLTKLILKGSPFKNVTIQEIAEQLISKSKCKTKLPTWFKNANIYYPNKINVEQTSSEIAAEYKSNLVSGKTLADITGGFGVDCFYFSKKIKKVFHCEINSELSEIVSHNYKQLGIDNCKTITKDGISFIENSKTDFDWIYTDPSRRDDKKEKVFLLKDCLPNIPENLELLLKKTKNILIKTSPILDIKKAISELNYVKEVHIVAINNDVKEVLYVLEKDFSKSPTIITINFTKNNIQQFNFQIHQKTQVSYSLPQTYLYEPNAAILKSGGFQFIASNFDINKLHVNTHLYTSNSLIEFPGRRFKIINTFPYNLKFLKKHLQFSKANITVRNFKESVTKIRHKTKITEGGNQYLFFTTNIDENPIILQCEKI